MATKAYILIETAVGKSREVAGNLRGITGMQAVDAVTGPYDIIVLLESDDLDTLGQAITGGIQRVDGVLRTNTCLVSWGISPGEE